MVDKAYRVLNINEMTRVAEAGGVEKYFRHQIRTKSGTILTVDIGEENFTAEKAAPILAEKAVEADKIKAL